MAFLGARGAADAEGLANEVFLKAFQGIEGFEGDESGFRAWVFTIARNLLIDERRRIARRPETTELHDDLARAGGNVEEDALERLGELWVYEALESLSPDQRDVLLLRVVAGLSVAEVAEVVGKRPGAVKALQRRGLAGLKRKILRLGVPR